MNKVQEEIFTPSDRSSESKPLTDGPLYNVVIIGAGPAGLVAALKLIDSSFKKVLILEEDPKYVGGISKTVLYKNYRFDIGGHRFFSKSKEIEDFWKDILGTDLLRCARTSRIFFNKKYFSYPLKASDVLKNLGIFECLKAFFSYLKSQTSSSSNITNFESWIISRFGQRLFKIFFKSYTEKVWGVDCKEISSDWAAQRIKGLSLVSAMIDSLIPNFLKKILKIEKPKTLTDYFWYPRLGPGMLWDKVAFLFQKKGGELFLGSSAQQFVYDIKNNLWRIEYKKNNSVFTVSTSQLISTMPIKNLCLALQPEFKSKSNALGLKYRDFITVALMIKIKDIFPDNWIYIHDPHVKVGRIQNFKNWSSELVPDSNLTCLGLEYFCFENDDFWALSDKQLIELASKELVSLGFCDLNQIVDSSVYRQKKAYPFYTFDYKKNIEAIKKEIEQNYPGLHLIGRNGMHKYNNQDHSIMTGILAAENIKAGFIKYNVWNVNQDAEYLEEKN